MLQTQIRKLSAFLFVMAVAASSALAGDGWSNLKAGDWAEFKSAPAPGMESHQKWVVKSADDTKVVYTIETTTLMNGAAVGPAATTELTYDKTATAPAAAASSASAGGANVTTAEETVTVNGKEIKAMVTSAEVEAAGQKMSTKTWTSPDVPFGIIKSEANGVVSLELVNWGSGS